MDKFMKKITYDRVLFIYKFTDNEEWWNKLSAEAQKQHLLNERERLLNTSKQLFDLVVEMDKS